jgi:hypothetical protein
MLLLMLALTACATLREQTTPGTPPPRAERPTYTLGEKWILNDGIYELIRIENDRYIFSAGPGQEIQLTKDLAIAKVQKGNQLIIGFDPPPALSWPLEVGKFGTRAGVSRSIVYPQGLHTTFLWSVDAYEEFVLPVGSVRAFRITYNMSDKSSWGSGRGYLRTWYSPELQQYLKLEGTGDLSQAKFHIVAIDRPAPSPLQIVLLEPKDQARSGTPSLTLTGKATGGSGISQVTVTLNGQEIARQEERTAPKPELPLSLPLTLQEGKNVLLVTATDAAGTTAQEARTLFYDAGAIRTATEELRTQMLARRGEAARVEAERLAPGLWAAATQREREAETALAQQDFPRAQAGYREAQEHYSVAAREAQQVSLQVQKAAEAQRLKEQAREARRAAELVEAARLVGPLWTQATRVEEEAEAAAARQEFDQAQGRFREAERAYREAEREAAGKAAALLAAERARLAERKRQLEAAEGAGRMLATARQAAEQRGARQYAANLIAAAQKKEEEGQLALGRQEYPTAQQRFQEAQGLYDQAAQEAGRAAERAREQARLQAERQREAEGLRDRMVEARGQAERTEARRLAPSLWTAAVTKEQEGQLALGRQEYPTAQQRFREARVGYEQAEREARRVAEAAALPPFQMTLASPADQARVEQENLALAGLVTGGRGVARVVVTLNGLEVSKLEQGTPQRAIPVNLPLTLKEGQNTLVVTATEVDGAMHQEVRTVHYEKRVPLTVSIRYPEDKAKLAEESTVVAALVTSSKGIAKVSVFINGVEVHQQAERTPPKSLVVTAPLSLREGLNAIVVTATEPDGTVKQELRTVLLDKPKVALPPPPPPPPARDRWAVVVGVGRYEHAEVPRLRYSVPDAEAIYQVLTGPAGFKPEYVHLLTDKTERKPTYRNLKWALGTFLARSAKKDDTVLIFFAGHGAPEVDQRGVERDGLAKYLIPSDADPDDLYSTALPMDELQTIFGRIEAERVVVFLDACYSGAAGGRTFTSKKTRAINLDDLFLERLTRAKGRAIITASRPSEVSLELADLGHGLFTYYLLRGLQGAADLNRDGIVSLQELYEYVEQQVSQKARAVGGNQHPVMKGELEGVLPLVKVQKP